MENPSIQFNLELLKFTKIQVKPENRKEKTWFYFSHEMCVYIKIPEGKPKENKSNKKSFLLSLICLARISILR
jgi:hypothetical protein